MIWLTSDWHFCHDKDFIWKPRGFSSVGQMNFEILARHNMVVSPEDTVYVLGDLMLGSDEKAGLEFVRRMNGQKIVIAGNHDTNHRRRDLYEKELGLQVLDATTFKYKGYTCYLSHFPTITTNHDEDKPLKARVINFCGHLHTEDRFCNMKEGMLSYHVEVDAHKSYPISIDDAIDDIKWYLEVMKNERDN